MNYKKVFDTMVSETAHYLTKNGLKSMILGLSGGLDSTVTAAICHEVVTRYPEQQFKFIGVSLPCSSNSVEENDSASLAMRAFCDEYWVENLQAQYLLVKATCEQRYPSTPISQGNIKARLRMIYLYNLASVTGGLVMDTDNLTEHNLGFWTIHGDVADHGVEEGGDDGRDLEVGEFALGGDPLGEFLAADVGKGGMRIHGWHLSCCVTGGIMAESGGKGQSQREKN
ncbi:MAG: NAD(+) synthase, partial [Eggerthellaceae bacterium]|nr:NAD(+) synthase [Eggerthellaceae bacterium]